MGFVRKLFVTSVAVVMIGAVVTEVEPPVVTAAAAGATASVSADGTFTVTFSQPSQRFGGRVSGPVSGISQASGTDRIGRYTEIRFAYSGRTAGIRTYPGTSVVLFTTTYGGPNTDAFPTFTTYPRLPYQQTYTNCFGRSQFNTTTNAGDSPWLSFDGNAEGFLLSPASHFPVARTWRAGEGALASGIDPAISTVPAGTTQQTLLVASRGINAAYRTWGSALTALHGKTRPANDADVTLNKLGYWTDNGATYYYRYDQNLGYAGTLREVKKSWEAKGIPMGYLQLDSWFYPKGPNARWEDKAGGAYRYEASPELFPGGLRTFADQLGAPLVTHGRWIDPASPYNAEYANSGKVVTDPAFWDDRMRYLAANRVATYEQDWLCSNAQPAYNLTDRDAYLDNMARAAARHGLTVQYCMPLPRDILQQSKYSNVTTTRVSEDRFERGKWDPALYGSQLAAAVGTWPWFDVMASTETRNVVLATLSAGPVGVGDPIGGESAPNLVKVARPDGVIVKPDAPLTPTDATYVGEAAGRKPGMVAATYTDHGPRRTAYVYAYGRDVPIPTPETVYQAEDAKVSGPTFSTEYAGYTGRGYVDFQHDSGDYVEWTVQAPEEGTYTLLFRYANGGGHERAGDVAVNGTSTGQPRFAASGGWSDWVAESAVVRLRAGANTVRLSATGSGGGNIDYLGVSAGVVNPGGRQDVSFTPSTLGVNGPAYVYDYFAGTGRVVAPGQSYTDALDRTGSYYVVAPINQMGIAFLGDQGKFVSMGRKRVTEATGSLYSASFATGEREVTMHGYAERPVAVQAVNGGVSGLTYDPVSRRFSFRVSPGKSATASFMIR
ncbi:CBM35 domain-containing protein [Lentzea sp. NPDC051213]|uniref:CBM35 domain-containing protein n=1 Tax=Lentzea sp. NPDC051213 TaxID=3364126 RepID=UPI00378D34DA